MAGAVWRSSAEQRLQARQQLGISPSARVVLFLGRLSFHSKAHPLPLYRSLGRLSADHELVLLECGHIFNTAIAAAYDQLGKRYPNLNLKRLGGLTAASEDEKKLALAAADLFCSPADNLQETFGPGVLEAMANSLPVVASDWNGYRDLVMQGSTGLLVPCRESTPGAAPARCAGSPLQSRATGLRQHRWAAQPRRGAGPRHGEGTWRPFWPLQNSAPPWGKQAVSELKVILPGVL